MAWRAEIGCRVFVDDPVAEKKRVKAANGREDPCYAARFEPIGRKRFDELPEIFSIERGNLFRARGGKSGEFLQIGFICGKRALGEPSFDGKIVDKTFFDALLHH